MAPSSKSLCHSQKDQLSMALDLVNDTRSTSLFSLFCYRQKRSILPWCRKPPCCDNVIQLNRSHFSAPQKVWCRFVGSSSKLHGVVRAHTLSAHTSPIMPQRATVCVSIILFYRSNCWTTWFPIGQPEPAPMELVGGPSSNVIRALHSKRLTSSARSSEQAL